MHLSILLPLRQNVEKTLREYQYNRSCLLYSLGISKWLIHFNKEAVDIIVNCYDQTLRVLKFSVYSLDATECETIYKDCDCSDEKCLDLNNTVCNQETGACECDELSGYSRLEGKCVLSERSKSFARFKFTFKFKTWSSLSCLWNATFD